MLVLLIKTLQQIQQCSPPPLPPTNTQNDIAPPLSMAAAKLIDKNRFRNAGLSKRN